MNEDIEELYQELIVDHFKNPRGKGCLSDADSKTTLFNPLCGDEVTVFLDEENGTIAKLRFTGKGCAISQASASMMSEICEGRTIADAKKNLESFMKMMKDSVAEEELTALGDAASLQGVKKFAARIRCATLGWEGLAKCLDDLDSSQ